MRGPTSDPLTADEWEALELAARSVPPPVEMPAIGTDADYPDYIENLLLTVLDLRLQNVIVNNALMYCRREHREDIRALEDLEAFLPGI